MASAAPNSKLSRMTALRYAPDGARYVLRTRYFACGKAICPNGRDMLLTERRMKHLIRATYVAHLHQRGRQECGAITEGGETPPLQFEWHCGTYNKCCMRAFFVILNGA